MTKASPVGRRWFALVLLGIVASAAMGSEAAWATGPEAWSAGRLSEGRMLHAAAPLLDGRVLVVGGQAQPTSAVLDSSEVWDPEATAFVPTGRLAHARTGATATTLDDGRVLVIGGWDGDATVADAEIWDPALGTYTSAGRLVEPRHHHTATLLDDGRVAIAGGIPGEFPSVSGDDAIRSIEIWDPASGEFSDGGSILGRSGHTATLLGDGRVVFAGGRFWDQGGGPLFRGGYTEIWDPATGRSDATSLEEFGHLKEGRADHAAVLTADGDVLVIGGIGFSETGLIGSIERFDVATGKWKTLKANSSGRAFHAALLQDDGSILVVGGMDTSGGEPTALRLAAQGKDFEEFGALHVGREGATYTPLEDGSILVVGGWTGLGAEPNAELWVPGTGDAYPERPSIGTITAGPKMRAARHGHTATTLPDGRVVVIGGASKTPDRKIRADIEVYDPRTGRFGKGGTLLARRTRHTATLLPDGRVLIAGGWDGKQVLGSTEILDPATGDVTPGPEMAGPRLGQSATLLADGRVLVAGGASQPDGRGTVGTLELLDPSTGLTVAAGELLHPREEHTATLLPDGRVLLVGGVADGDGSWDYDVDPPSQAGHFVTQAEVVDPTAGSSAEAGSTGEERIGHTASLLPDGRVLVVSDGPWDAMAILWDPATGDFTRTPQQPRFPRTGHSAVTLPDGRVLLIGGESTGQDLAYYQDGPFGGAAEVYDPGSGTFSETPDANGSLDVTDARIRGAAALLGDGTVLLTGGSGWTAEASSLLWSPAAF